MMFCRRDGQKNKDGLVETDGIAVMVDVPKREKDSAPVARCSRRMGKN